MSNQTVSINCPGCGAPVSIEDTRCQYCDRPIAISTFNSIYDMPLPEINKYVKEYNNALAEAPNNSVLNTSIAMCYLKLRLYDKASAAFDKAIEDNINNSEMFFYAAICLLKGKKAFLQQRPTIDKIQEYIDAATAIEPKGIYYYFLAYIKYDYFKRKFFKTSPDYSEVLEIAKNKGISEHDVSQLYSILGVERPECL